MAKLIISDRFDIISQDWGKIAKNALIFAGPALIVLIGSTVSVLPKEWALAPVVLYLLNVLTDILKKFIETNTYRPKDR